MTHGQSVTDGEEAAGKIMALTRPSAGQEEAEQRPCCQRNETPGKHSIVQSARILDRTLYRRWLGDDDHRVSHTSDSAAVREYRQGGSRLTQTQEQFRALDEI